MTIVEAISVILTAAPAGLTSREIYGKIVEHNLYEFPAENPPAVVNSMIRRHCVDLNFPTSSPKKHFKIVGYQGKRPKYALVECDRTGYLRKRDTAGQAGETMENQRRGAGNG